MPDQREELAGSSRQAWWIAALLCVVAMLNYLDRQVIFSILPIIRAELHCTDTQLGLLATSFLWVYGAVSPLAGFVAVRLGLRRVILLSLAFWSLVTLLTALARNPVHLIGARALMGFSEAFYLPAGLALVTALHSERTRSRATALHQCGIYFGLIGGGVLGGWAGERFGWRPLFLVLGAAGLLYALFLAPFLRRLPPKAVAAPPREPLLRMAGELLRIRGYAAMVCVFCVFSASGWIALTWMALYLYERFGVSVAESAFTSAFYLNAGSFTGIFLGAWISDRFCRRYPRIRAALSASAFLCSGLFLLGAAMAGSVAVIPLCLAFYGFGRGMFDCNIMPLLCELARPELRAAGYGIFNFGGCLTGGVMAVGAGALKQTIGLDGAMIFAALLTIAGALLFIPIARAIAAAKSPAPAAA